MRITRRDFLGAVAIVTAGTVLPHPSFAGKVLEEEIPVLTYPQFLSQFKNVYRVLADIQDNRYKMTMAVIAMDETEWDGQWKMPSSISSSRVLHEVPASYDGEKIHIVGKHMICSKAKRGGTVIPYQLLWRQAP